MAQSPIDSWLSQLAPQTATARRGYLICATPRSGSYFLCDLLRSTGVLGRPHEFFGTAAMRWLGMAEYPTEIAAQLEMVLTRGCTPNGVFGAKLFPLQIAAAPPGTILTGMNDPLLIYLERADLLGQAISLTRAAITNSYFAGQKSAMEPEFDGPLLRDYLELIIHWNAAWQLWFARRGIVPLRLLYEEVVADPHCNVARIAEALGGLGPVEIDQAQLTMAIQRDRLSDEWRERFLVMQPQGHPLDLPRPAALVNLQRRTRRLLRMLGLRRD